VRLLAGVLAALLVSLGAAAAQERATKALDAPAPSSPREALQQARAAFEFQDYALAERLLAVHTAGLETPAQRAEGYRLLGIARFYQNKVEGAESAFFELLKLEPDEELDPFYVSPRAIAFFDQVKRERDAELQPIRDQRKREADERRKAAEAEAAEKKQRDQEEEARRLNALRPPTILERRVVQREFWVSLMPFGIGQFQNGDQTLGTVLATSEIVAGSTSALSALLIEGLRDRSTGKFSRDSYNIAKNLEIAKWASAGAFYALWLGGAVHAAVKFKPETTGSELVLPSAATPAQQPGAILPPAPPPGTNLNPAFVPAPTVPR
jgi:hypothetical protein